MNQVTTWMTVVGLVADVKEDRFNFRIARPAWYIPYSQVEWDQAVTLVARVAEPRLAAGAVRAAIREQDPAQPLATPTILEEHVAGVFVTERFTALLIATLAAVGLLLASIGLYGVMAYSVSRRTAEIGLRLALGSRPWPVVRLVLIRGIVLVGIGLAIGLVAAGGLGTLLTGVLYGVQPSDPVVFVLVSALVAAVSIIACGIPAIRATRIDPLAALRAE
jgi:putative ABC transport system permease protein